MFKQTVNYTDFDGNPQTEVLHFNLTKTELMDNLELKHKLESVQDRISGAERELTVDEIRMLLDVVRTLMKASYGVRSEDGKRFIKNEQVWTEFTQTAAYDETVFSLFRTPEEALAFMQGIVPKDLADQVAAEAAKEGVAVRPKVPLDRLQKGLPTAAE